MRAISKKLCLAFGGRHTHFCPGCNELHGFYISEPNPTNGARWQFDGNVDSPSFSPSMNIAAHDDAEGIHEVCHYFLRAGVLQFLSDCTHSLAGQQVELPDLPEWILNHYRVGL